MRTKCANCGMIYDIFISDMEMRTPLQVAQSGICPQCGSNAHNPVSVQYSINSTNWNEDDKK
jgi:predicted  nucleic acid-binding Zn-ribbon protein